MEFDIYSIGESAFLEQVLNAVAMITGEDSFRDAVAIGMLLGVLLTAWQLLTGGGKGGVDISQIVVCLILYMCMFVPRATVVIEDAYTGAVRPVDNVPVGVAAVGSMLSSVGYGLTRLFEQGYAPVVPGITETQFADALKILNDVRRRAGEPKVFQAINVALGDGSMSNLQNGTAGGSIDFRRSWYNYIKECSLKNIDLHRVSLDTMMNHSMIEALQFRSSIHRTLLYMDTSNPYGTNMTCSDAYTLLVARTNEAFSTPTVKNAIAESAGIKLFEDDDLYTRLNTGVSALSTAGAAAVEAQKYVMASVLDTVYAEAAQGRYTDMRDFSSAAMVSQAIQQRNTQWASEQTMFLSTVRPMLALIEGFVYAVTPLMGFLIVMGAFGIKLVGKYIQMLIWIQLWMPVLAIINLYLYMAASAELAADAGATSGVAVALDSFYGLYRSDEILANWLATGGMLAAATPVLTLMLVTGSTYAWASLAQRMNGADHINEKIATPDAISNGPALNNLAMNSNTNVGGTAGTDADSLLPNFSFNSILGSAASSSERFAEGKREQFSRTLSNSLTDNVSQQQTYALAEQFGRQISNRQDQSSQALMSAANSYARDHGLGAEHVNAIAGGMQIGMNGQLGFDLSFAKGGQGSKDVSGDKDEKGGKGGKGGIGGGISAQGYQSSTEANSVKYNEAEGMKYLQNAGYTQTQGATLSDSLAHDIKSMNTKTLSNILGEERASQLQSLASESIDASRDYAKTSSLSQSFASTTGLTLNDISNTVANNKDAFGSLHSFVRDYADRDVKRHINELKNSYTDMDNPYRMDEKKAFVAAAIAVMGERNNFKDEGKYYDSVGVVGDVIGKALGRNMQSSPEASYSRNSDLEDKSANIAQGVRDDAENIQAPRAVNRDDVQRGSSTSAHVSPAMQNMSSDGPVGEAFERASQKAEVQASAWGTKVQTDQINSVFDSVINAPKGSSAYSNAGLGQTAESALLSTNVGASVAGAQSWGYEKAAEFTRKISGWDDEKLAEFKAASERGEDLSRFEVSDGPVSGALRSVMGAVVGGFLGDEVTENMTNEQASAVYFGQMSAAMQGKSERVSEESLARSGEQMAERKREEALRLGQTEAMAEFYGSQFTSDNQVRTVAKQVADVPANGISFFTGLAVDITDAVHNDQSRQAFINQDLEKTAHRLGYKSFADMPAEEQQSKRMGMEKAYEHIEFAARNPELERSELQYGSRIGAVINGKDIVDKD
ncbi:conjugal transfer protein TraG N-terminal domain-containing protein [Pseudomonas sp.]|uniref:conjugal transfer protein TraG N-terminal domain-containing protein n=1 Tax=Pseudomonas sp. TaxID=306 RepID=UPI00289A3858|nr:conjugal transfer protein TraG N-terminal domain-containing protein [Pseudomonas sp.]